MDDFREIINDDASSAVVYVPTPHGEGMAKADHTADPILPVYARGIDGYGRPMVVEHKYQVLDRQIATVAGRERLHVKLSRLPVVSTIIDYDLSQKDPYHAVEKLSLPTSRRRRRR